VSHTNKWWAAARESVPPNTWTESGLTPILGEVSKQQPHVVRSVVPRSGNRSPTLAGGPRWAMIAWAPGLCRRWLGPKALSAG